MKKVTVEGKSKEHVRKAHGRFKKRTKAENLELIPSYLSSDTTFLEPIIPWSTLYIFIIKVVLSAFKFDRNVTWPDGRHSQRLTTEEDQHQTA